MDRLVTTFCFVRTSLTLVFLSCHRKFQCVFDVTWCSQGLFEYFFCWSFQSETLRRCKVLRRKLRSLVLFYQRYSYFIDREKNIILFSQNLPTLFHGLLRNQKGTPFQLGYTLPERVFFLEYARYNPATPTLTPISPKTKL